LVVEHVEHACRGTVAATCIAIWQGMGVVEVAIYVERDMVVRENGEEGGVGL
jgi:hypothetical protein